MDLFELLGTITIDNSNANRQLEDTTGRASKSGKSIMSSFKAVAGAIGAYLTVDAIKDFGLGCINAAADASASASQFSQVFGDLEGSASKSLSEIANNAGITETRMKDSFTKIAAFAKTTGMDTESALNLSERAMIAVADSAAFYDRSLEETTESLQSFLKGNYENDAALGLSCTEVTRNTAANELYGKSFKDLSEEQKQLTLLKMVEDANKLSGALGQAARESETWTNVTGNLKQSWTDFQAAIGKHVLPMATGLVKKLSEFVQTSTGKVEPAVEFLTEKFQKLKDWFSEVGGYASSKLQPVLDDLQWAFTTVKDAVQPLIDKMTEYVEGGEAAEDITTFVKDAIDLMASAYEGAVGLVQGVAQGFQNAVTWGREHETSLAMIATAMGTLTAAIVAYNIAQAIKNAGGIVELAQLGATAVGYYALVAAETAHTVATTIATAATTAFGAVLSFLTSPITLVVVAIGALIAIGVALYKNWDVITEKAGELWSNVKDWFSKMAKSVTDSVTKMKDAAVKKFNEMKTNAVNKFNEMKTNATNKVNELKNNAVNKFNELKTNATNKVNELKTSAVSKFNEIKDGIVEKINWARDKVGEAVEKIKGLFDFEWSLPKPKIPKFKVSGGKAPWGFMGEGSLPSVSVEWYKHGGILTRPTLFDYNPATGTARVGGEAGDEAVAPISTLQQYVRAAVDDANNGVVQKLDRIVDLLVQFFPDALTAMQTPMVLDTGVLVAETAPAMDIELGKIAIKKGRGR